jgi:AraC-like DNA-binding protein/ligand-binding sensor protein
MLSRARHCHRLKNRSRGHPLATGGRRPTIHAAYSGQYLFTVVLVKKIEAAILAPKRDTAGGQLDYGRIRGEFSLREAKNNGDHCAFSRQAVGCSLQSSSELVQQLNRSRIFQNYAQAFQKTTNLPLELSTSGGWREVHWTRSKFINPFCAILARTSKNCDACLELQRKLTSTNIAETQTVKCFAGLTNTSVPVKVEGRVMAFLQTGQVFLRTPSGQRFKKIATQLIRWGMKNNLTRLEKAYFRTRVISPGLYRGVVRLLEIFAEHLGLIANQIVLRQTSGDSLIVRRAKDYVARHQSDPISLAEICRTLNVSTFHFCRTFKQTTGLTFVEYLSRVRIEKAKSLLHKSDLRVSEIAYEVGFQSITHFNRVFRKIVGYSPTVFRSRFAISESQRLTMGSTKDSPLIR